MGTVLARGLVLDHVGMHGDVDIQVRFTVDDDALTELHRLAFACCRDCRASLGEPVRAS